MVICSAIAFGFIPVYACSPNFAEEGALPSCNLDDSVECCSRGQNMGWRYLLFTIGGITLFVFIMRFFVFNFRETPKFLIYKGRDDEALATIRHIAEVNKKPCGLSLASFEAIQREHDSIESRKPVLGSGAKQTKANLKSKLSLETDRYMMLFSSWQMTRLTILVWLTYIMDFWGFTVAGKLQVVPPDIARELTRDRLLPSQDSGFEERTGRREPD